MVIKEVDLARREPCDACGDRCRTLYWTTCGKCGFDHKLCEECWGMSRPTEKLCTCVRDDRVMLELMR